MRELRFVFVASLVAWAACGDNHPGVGTDAPSGPPCSDGADNDNDGTIDFPDDLGCDDANDDTEDSAAKPACSDNRDNDDDGKVDYPHDPGCPAPNADDEVDPCPGAGCPQCADGKDNDNNGKTDFPDDTGCISAYDGLEFTDDPNACGQGMVIKPLPTTGTDTGTLVGTTSTVSSPCGGGNGLPAIAYIFHLTTPKVIVASTDDPMTMINTVLDLRSSMCDAAGSEIACHDDILPTGTTPNRKSKVTYSLGAGTYYLIVGGKTAADTGQYALKVEFFPGKGTPCATVADCGPTLECRVPFGQTQMVCIGAVCNDGIDDDGDGKIDYPADPGCATKTDSTETDTCATPTDPACPACSNTLDDDMDGQIDYPNDATCVAASTIGEACPQSEPIIVATTPQTTGSTTASSGAVNDYAPPMGSFNGHACSSSTVANTAPDRAVQIDVPSMTTLSLRLSPVSFDSAQILFNSTCGGTPIECYDSPSLMVMNNLAAGRYYLVIDGFSTASGTFTLNVSGTILNGESCESPLAQSGAITCAAGYACLGTMGSRVCALTQCNDGIDNNGDGRMDYPADPSCSGISDLTEETICPGAGCPICSDGLDNDSDTFIDYPADTDCVSASSNNEGCRETDAIMTITAPQTTGTLVGATDDHNPSCVTSNAPDKIFLLDIPTTLQSLVIDTENSTQDTVLSLLGATCDEPSIACDDDGGVGIGDSLIQRSFVQPGSYAIAVDAFSATSLNTFNLNVKGTILPGGGCESSLFQAGVLVCPPGYGCSGAPGARTCTNAECQDGVDNNSDGVLDYPSDPGCDAPSDLTEATVCPGSTCPICSDGIDNDNDGRTDYPADPRCTAASGGNEGCLDTDPIATILMPVTSGTLVGKTNDHQPFCATTVSNDDIYTLTIPNLDSLVIDTNGSTQNTVLSLMTSDCSEPALACDNDGGDSVSSLITRGFTQGGTYTIAVDADSTTPNTYVLNIEGVISPGESCESPLVSTGVLRCSIGFACDGPVGMRTCSLAQCVDGIDNNLDGRTDFPADPGCDSFSDDTETTVCPGPSCPVCSDGVDNDGDGVTDYPADNSCLTASWPNEACTQSEPVGLITQRVTTGTTTGATNDSVPACATGTHSAPDLAYKLEIPAMETLRLIQTGFTTGAVTLLDSTCNGAVACSAPSFMTRTNVPAGTYYVVVDGSTSGSGGFTLTTTGTVAPGGSCEGQLFQSGAFTCSSGYECAGTMGSRTCTPAQCADMIDNDGDGVVDYPSDAGCVSASDSDETDDCTPTVGPNCPACSNALDDDMDMLTDYPADTRCISASFFVENFCSNEPNFAGAITFPVTAGTLTGAAANYQQTCDTTTGNDVAFALRLPVPVVTLVIDNIGSTSTDTVLSLWNPTCTTQVACDADSDPDSARAMLTLSNVAAGNYAIQVDAGGTTTTTNTDFLLNVRGTVAAGTACTDPLFTAGVLNCPTGTTCTAGTCQ